MRARRSMELRGCAWETRVLDSRRRTSRFWARAVVLACRDGARAFRSVTAFCLTRSFVFDFSMEASAEDWVWMLSLASGVEGAETCCGGTGAGLGAMGWTGAAAAGEGAEGEAFAPASA